MLYQSVILALPAVLLKSVKQMQKPYFEFQPTADIRCRVELCVEDIKSLELSQAIDIAFQMTKYGSECEN